MDNEGKEIIKKIINAIHLLFGTLAGGVLAKYILNLEWVEVITDIAIIIFVIMITILKIKMDNKAKQEIKVIENGKEGN